MIRTKLRTALLATLTLGVIAAGAGVLAQPTGGRRDQPETTAGGASRRGAAYRPEWR